MRTAADLGCSISFTHYLCTPFFNTPGRRSSFDSGVLRAENKAISIVNLSGKLFNELVHHSHCNPNLRFKINIIVHRDSFGDALQGWLHLIVRSFGLGK